MNKSKIILASVGGVALVASLVLAYLIWSAMSDKSEKTADLDGAIATADRLTRLPVYPGPDGIKAYNENAETYKAWREEAVKIASAGDMAFEATTPPAFKAFLVDDARRLSALPGAVDGRLVKDDFPFGFKDYITGGVLPAQADLARLQREWYDVSTVIESLAKCGVSEIVDVTIKPPAPAQPEQTAKNNKKNKGKKKPAKGETQEQGPAVTCFTVDFRTRPAGLVNAINEFITSSRFVVVDDFSFMREKDDIADAIGGDGKKQQESQPRGRRGRRGRAAEEDETPKSETEKGQGVVTDPMTASLLRVSMTFSVYDFRSLEGGAADAGADAEKSEEAK